MNFQKIANLITRLFISSVADDGDRQLLSGESHSGQVLTDIPRLQQYGFGSHPPAGSEAILAAVAGGEASKMAIIADKPAARPKNMQAADVFLHDEQAIRLLLRGGDVELSPSATLKIKIGETEHVFSAEGYQIKLAGAVVYDARTHKHPLSAGPPLPA